MFVTARLPILVASGVVPVALLPAAGGPAWLLALAWLVLCAVLAAVDVVTAADGAALRVSRDVPPRVTLGDATRTRVRFGNPTGRRIRGLIRDGWQPTAGAPAERQRIDVPPGESRTIVVPLRPRRRGELRTQFVVVRTRGPLGLAGRQRRSDARWAIRVLPPLQARRHLPSREARMREFSGAVSVQVCSHGTEFDSLREYVRGDDVPSIDWRATARAGTTMLRTWRPERDRH